MTTLNFTYSRKIKLEEAKELISSINWQLLQKGFYFNQINQFEYMQNNEFLAIWKIKDSTIAEVEEARNIINN